MHGHLVAVEIGIERGTDQRMKLDRLTLDQHRFEGLNAKPMQGRRAVEHDRMLANDLVENIPDLGPFLLDQFLRLLDRRRISLGIKARIDKWLEKFERHFLRQTTLVELQLRPDDDHRATGIVDPLAEKILAEAALLAFQHIGKRLQRTLVGAGNDPAATSVVEQRINRLLQHALLIADDNIGSPQFDQPLQTIVTIDNPAI